MEAQAGALRSPEKADFGWRPILQAGLIGFGVTVYLCITGIVGTFAERPIIADVVSLGLTSLLLAYVAAGYLGARAARVPGGMRIAAGAFAPATGPITTRSAP